MKEIQNISVQTIYQRCLYASLANTVCTFRQDSFSYEQSWNKRNYSFIWDRVRGTVSFRDDIAVIVLRHENHSFGEHDHRNFRAEFLSDNTPDAVRTIAQKETLTYLCDDLDDETGPGSMSGMWILQDTLYIPEDIQVDKNRFFEQILCLSSCGKPGVFNKQFWTDYYSLTEVEQSVLELLFQCRLTNSTDYQKNKDFLFMMAHDYNHSQKGITLLKEVWSES